MTESVIASATIPDLSTVYGEVYLPLSKQILVSYYSGVLTINL